MGFELRQDQARDRQQAKANDHGGQEGSRPISITNRPLAEIDQSTHPGSTAAASAGQYDQSPAAAGGDASATRASRRLQPHQSQASLPASQRQGRRHRIDGLERAATVFSADPSRKPLICRSDLWPIDWPRHHGVARTFSPAATPKRQNFKGLATTAGLVVSTAGAWGVIIPNEIRLNVAGSYKHRLIHRSSPCRSFGNVLHHQRRSSVSMRLRSRSSRIRKIRKNGGSC